MRLTVRVSGATEPFPHTWENSSGSGHWAMALRADYRSQLRRCRDELGFRRVRMHGMMDDDMSTSLGPGEGSYVNLDSVIDFLAEIGMAPLFEIGFMPGWLAAGGGTWFHYKGQISPPRDYAQWGAVMGDLARHLLGRYGEEAVAEWFFEVWNEPDLHMWTGSPKMDTYFKLYQTTAQAFASVSRRFRLGGPATSSGQWLGEFLDFCNSTGTPVSFVSSHLYAGGGGGATLDVAALAGGLAAMNGRIAGRAPFFVTEWGGTWSHDPALDETSYAPFIIEAAAANARVADVLSFWAFSDVFEEQGMPAAAYANGFGLLNVFGVPKPSYRAFQLLHWAGDERVPIAQAGGAGSCPHTVSGLATRNATHLSVFVTNHAPLPGGVADCTVVLDIPPGAAAAARIDADHANPKAAWEAMGSPKYPSAAQLAALERGARLDLTRFTASGEVTVRVPGRGVYAVFVEL